MSILNFPASPSEGDLYDFGAYRYRFDGEKWSTIGNAFNQGAILASQAREALRRSYAEIGLTLVSGSFELGGVVTSNTDVLLYESTGVAYAWDGSFPVGGKTVTAGSTPSSSGGIGAGFWLSKNLVSLRQLLSNEQSGAKLVKLSRSSRTVDQGILDSGIARGNDGYNYALSGAAFRRYTPDSADWGMVTDATHIPVNTFSVTNGVSVQINYKGNKIGSLICGPDESFAMDGVSVGGSVGPDNAIISMGAPCSFLVDFDNSNAITQDARYFDAVRFGCSISAGGQVTVTHPQRRLMQYPLVQHYASLSTNEKYNVHCVSSPSPDAFTCFLIGEAEGQIAYTGSAWAISSSMWGSSEVTLTYDAPNGTLTVVHPTVLGSPGISVDPLWNGSPVHTHVKDVSSTGFKVVFTKPDGTYPTLSSALGFLFTRGMSGIVKNPTGKLHVFLGNVQVNMNHVSYQFGNFWTIGLMRDDTI